MPSLTNDLVQRMLAAGKHEASVIDKPFALCVVDAGGHMLASFRDVAAAPAAGHSAETKARTAVNLHADTGAVPPQVRSFRR